MPFLEGKASILFLLASSTLAPVVQAAGSNSCEFGGKGCQGAASIQNTNAHQENGILLLYQTHIYCVLSVILHGRSRGSRNPGGLPRSMVSCFESRNREASDLPFDGLM